MADQIGLVRAAAFAVLHQQTIRRQHDYSRTLLSDNRSAACVRHIHAFARVAALSARRTRSDRLWARDGSGNDAARRDGPMSLAGGSRYNIAPSLRVAMYSVFFSLRLLACRRNPHLSNIVRSTA